VLTLREAIRSALERAPEVALAKAQAERASQAVRETRSANLPQIVTGTGLAYNNGFPLSIEGAAPSIFEVGFSQSIFSKKNKNLILEAEENSKASSHGPESARIELAARTALVYYDLHQARKLNDLWTDRLEAAMHDQEITRSLLEAGKVRPLDLTMAKTAVAIARQQVLVSSEQGKVAEAELRELTGIAEPTPIRTEEPDIENQLFEEPVESICNRALETSPEILQAEADLRAKEFHVQAEKGESRPRLDLVTQYALFSKTNNYQDFFNKFTRNNFLVGLSVQVPIFDGFRTGARVAESRQEVAGARFRLQRMKSDLKLNIERSMSGLRIALGAEQLAAGEVSAAQENLQVNEVLLKGGRVSTRELHDARVQVREKEISQLESRKEVFRRKLELLRITGTLSALYTP
jgi:outer membrane protein